MGIKKSILHSMLVLSCCCMPAVSEAGNLDILWGFGTGLPPNTTPTDTTGSGTTAGSSSVNTTIVPVGVLPNRTVSPVINVIQTSTELNSAGGTATVSVESAKDKNNSSKSKSRSSGKAAIGFEAFVSENQQMYVLPLSYAVTPELQFGMAIPFVLAKHQLLDEKNNSINWSDFEYGVGDIAANVKYLYTGDNGLESVSILTLKFATGDENLGLGTGSYDLTITQKILKNFDKFRVAGMLGFTQALNEPDLPDILDIRKHTIYDNGTTDLFRQYAPGRSKVRYGTSVTYMAAAETNMFYNPLWLGLKLSGVHVFEGERSWGVTDYDKYGWAVRDGKSPRSFTEPTVTTMDITPEVKYFISGNLGLNASVIIPVVSQTGGENSSRDIVFNFGLAKAF